MDMQTFFDRDDIIPNDMYVLLREERAGDGTTSVNVAPLSGVIDVQATASGAILREKSGKTVGVAMAGGSIEAIYQAGHLRASMVLELNAEAPISTEGSAPQTIEPPEATEEAE